MTNCPPEWADDSGFEFSAQKIVHCFHAVWEAHFAELFAWSGHILQAISQLNFFCF